MTYAVFGIAYLVGVFVFLLLSFFNFYTLIRFGISSRFPVVLSVLYLVAFLAIILTTQRLLANVDWAQPIRVDLPSITPSDYLPNVDLGNVKL